MLDSSREEMGNTTRDPEASPELGRRRRKRHRAHRQKRLERIQRKALIAFLFVLTIVVTLAIWYELLKT
jgi:hypothetical protein